MEHEIGALRQSLLLSSDDALIKGVASVLAPRRLLTLEADHAISLWATERARIQATETDPQREKRRTIWHHDEVEKDGIEVWMSRYHISRVRAGGSRYPPWFDIPETGDPSLRERGRPSSTAAARADAALLGQFPSLKDHPLHFAALEYLCKVELVAVQSERCTWPSPSFRRNHIDRRQKAEEINDFEKIDALDKVLKLVNDVLRTRARRRISRALRLLQTIEPLDPLRPMDPDNRAAWLQEKMWEGLRFLFPGEVIPTRPNARLPAIRITEEAIYRDEEGRPLTFPGIRRSPPVDR